MRLSPLAAHLAPLALPPSTVHQDHHGHYHHDHRDNRNQRTLLEKKIEKKSLICKYVLVMTVTTVQVFSPVEGTKVSR